MTGCCRIDCKTDTIYPWIKKNSLISNPKLNPAVKRYFYWNFSFKHSKEFSIFPKALPKYPQLVLNWINNFIFIMFWALPNPLFQTTNKNHLVFPFHRSMSALTNKISCHRFQFPHLRQIIHFECTEKTPFFWPTKHFTTKFLALVRFLLLLVSFPVW